LSEKPKSPTSGSSGNDGRKAVPTITATATSTAIHVFFERIPPHSGNPNARLFHIPFFQFSPFLLFFFFFFHLRIFRFFSAGDQEDDYIG
jgi:hypothetical protein